MAHYQQELNGHSLDRLVEQIEFKATFAFAFVAFLLGALLALLLPWTWRRRFQSNERRWFIERAWQDAGSFTQLAFTA